MSVFDDFGPPSYAPPPLGSDYSIPRREPKLKIFAPDGSTLELRGYAGIRPANNSSRLEVIVQDGKGNVIQTVGRRCVIVSLKEDTTTFTFEKESYHFNPVKAVLYDPRHLENTVPFHLGRRIQFFTDTEQEWLDEHPEWPSQLELYDEPVADGDGLGIQG